MRIRRFPLTLMGVALLLWLPVTLAQSEDPTGTQWRLLTIDGAPVLADTLITLSLDANGTAGGNSGCNSYGGSYTLSDGTISLSQLASTLMACLDEAVMEQEAAYLAALQAAAQIERSGSKLTITYGDGRLLEFVTYDPLLGTQWRLTDIGGAPALADTPVTLEFRFGQQVVGSGGCNRYRGSYTLLTGTGLNFAPLISTMMACAGEGVSEQETAFLSALQTTAYYEMQGEQLTLWTAADQSMTFTLTGRDPLVGTQWQLNDAAANSTVTLSFDEDGKVSGSGGCNTFSGSYTIGQDSLSFGPLASTKKACADETLMKQEQDFFAALEAASSYALVGDELSIAAGEQTLRFSPLVSS